MMDDQEIEKIESCYIDYLQMKHLPLRNPNFGALKVAD